MSSDDDVLSSLVSEATIEETESHAQSYMNRRVTSIEDDRGADHVKATRLFEISSVTINISKTEIIGDTTTTTTTHCEVYGYIEVTDEHGYKRDIFRRDRHNPEVVSSLGGNLILTNTRISPLIPNSFFKVDVFLRDKIREVEIAKNSFDLDFDHNVEYDELKTYHVYGKSGFAILHYCTFESAVIAQVDVKLINNKAEDNDHVKLADVCGNISATIEGAGRDISRLLFEKQRYEPVSVNYKNENKCLLTRSMIVVPAYAFLKIHINLLDANTSQELASGLIVDFEATDDSRPTKEISGEEYDIHVNVIWRHPYYLLGDDKKLNHDHRSTSPTISIAHIGISQPLIEVFGVSIRTNVGPTVSLHGFIDVRDDDLDEYCLFEKNKGDPHVLSVDIKSLPLNKLDCCPKGTRFILESDIMDHEDREISRGFMHWCIGNIGSLISWYDKRICSVIRGEFGHALIYYVIFRDGAEAKVSVLFTSPSNTIFNVHGKIVTEYEGYPYESEYDKEFYRSAIFEKAPNHAIQLSDDMEFPLSKQYVAVPFKSSLTIKPQLYLCARGGDKQFEELFDSVTFPMKGGVSSQVLEGNGCSLSVRVEFARITNLK